MALTPRKLMEMAVQQGKLSTTENNRADPTPSVGAVLAVGDDNPLLGHRGKVGEGTHAEYSILGELKEVPDGAILYTTLEPCTLRGPKKTPCAKWIINRNIKKVVIGLIDPNRKIQGDGFWLLREHGIEVSFFDSDLIAQIENDNRKFIDFYRPKHWLPPAPIRGLDDWYFIINAIYIDKNYYRHPTMVLSHLVEVLGGLSLLATGKKKPDVTPELFFPKSLAWWFALCGSVGVKSVEEALWLKFPSVCSYCHSRPHDNKRCLQAKLANRNPDWPKLRELGEKNGKHRPRTLGDWKKMFDEIYPTSQAESYEAVFGRLGEEMGELSECIRVLELAPNSFLSEASDVFAWLMKLANVYEARETLDLDLSNLLFERYPDRCRDCGNAVCSCRPFLPHTLSRIAHDGPPAGVLSLSAALLSHSERADRFDLGSKSIAIGDRVLESTPKLFSAVYDLARDFQNALRTYAIENPTTAIRVVAWCQQMNSLVASQRVSQRVVDEFLLLARNSEEGERNALLDALSKVEKSEFRDSLVAFVEGTSSPAAEQRG